MAVSETAFPDPDMRKAAQLVVEGSVASAIDTARKIPGGINSVGPERDTLLNLAVRRNSLAAVRALLAAGADPSVPSDRAPIAIAAELASIDVVAALIEAHADPNGATNGEPALWRAALTGRREVAEMLIREGADVDGADPDGVTPAIAAAKADKYTVVLLLLENGASPFAKGVDSTSLAEWAQQSRINPKSSEGHAREVLYAALRKLGAM